MAGARAFFLPTRGPVHPASPPPPTPPAPRPARLLPHPATPATICTASVNSRRSGRGGGGLARMEVQHAAHLRGPDPSRLSGRDAWFERCTGRSARLVQGGYELDSERCCSARPAWSQCEAGTGDRVESAAAARPAGLADPPPEPWTHNVACYSEPMQMSLLCLRSGIAEAATVSWTRKYRGASRQFSQALRARVIFKLIPVVVSAACHDQASAPSPGQSQHLRRVCAIRSLQTASSTAIDSVQTVATVSSKLETGFNLISVKNNRF
jgi:hypothetical protein